jgi:hypothetical protein
MCPGRHGSSLGLQSYLLFVCSTFSHTIPVPAVTTCLPGLALPFRRRRLAAGAEIDVTFNRYALCDSLRQEDLTLSHQYFYNIFWNS